MQSHRAVTVFGMVIVGMCGTLAPARALAQAPGAMTQPAAKHKEQPGGSSKAPLAPGSLFIVLTVRDSGTTVEREERTQAIAVPQPGEAKRFERSVPARPGYIIADVKLGAPTHPAVGNLQAVVAEDRRLVTILGEWSADALPVLQAGSSAKGVATSDTAVPLTLVEEKRTSVELPAQVVEGFEPWGQFGWGEFGQGELSLPPQPSKLEDWKRRVDLEIRTAGEGGRSYLLLSAPSVQFPWSGQVPKGGRCAQGFGAEQAGNKIRYTLGVWQFP
jgi:hypothetical protein